MNEFLLELNQYCKSIDIGQSGFVSILKNICPVETMSDASLANDDSIRLKVNRMKTNLSRLTTSNRKEEKQNFLGSLFEFPCIAQTKAIDSEFNETADEDKNKFLTVVRTLVDENRGLKRKSKELEECQLCTKLSSD